MTVDERVTIVDQNDCVKGSALRSEMRANRLCHRVTYILVFNQRGDLLVQERTTIKDVYPGMLDLAAGGVVVYDEDYKTSAQRELGEELGLYQDALTPLFKSYFEDEQNRCWGEVFRCDSEGPFVLQESEVVKAQFHSLDEVLALNKNNVTPDTYQVVKQFMSQLRNE